MLSQIIPRVYISDWETVYKTRLVESFVPGPRAIVCMALETTPETLKDVYHYVKKCGMHDEHPNCPVNTDEQIQEAVNTFTQFWINGLTVISQCRAGQNRSCAVVTGFLVSNFPDIFTVDTAYAFIKHMHPEANITESLLAHMRRLYDVR